MKEHGKKKQSQTKGRPTVNKENGYPTQKHSFKVQRIIMEVGLLFGVISEDSFVPQFFKV